MSLEAVKHAIILAATLYGALLLGLFLLQEGMIYYPDLPGRDYETTPDHLGMPYEELTLTTADDIRLAAWYVPAENPQGVLIYAHGNAGNISHRLDAIRLFRDMGLSVLIFDFRGYGKSKGKPSEEGTYRDAEAAWQYLVMQRGTPPGGIVIFGESLGAAVAAHLAAQHPPGALVLASAFTSVPDLAADLYPFIPARWLARYRYDTRRYLQDIRSPVLVMHSREDEIIPYRHGLALYEAAPEPRQFLELRGGHNDLYFANEETFAREVGKFVNRQLIRRDRPPLPPGAD